MTFTLNKEYAHRHLFVVILMAALGCWFGYDGFVRYPATPAAELYRSIEGSDAPADFDLDGFKRQKTQAQYGFTLLSFLAALVVGLRLNRARRFTGSFDDAGFAFGVKRYGWSDVAHVDRTRWESKGILVLALKDGAKVVLDAWHHVGVRDFEKALAGRSAPAENA